MKRVLVFYAIWLIAINAFALYSLQRVNLLPDTAYNWISPSDFHQIQSQNFLEMRAHWDSVWYLRIVQEGYQYIPGQMSSVVFFPLYPLMIWALSWLMSPLLAGWLISTVAMAIAIIFFYKLVQYLYPHLDPAEPIYLMLLFPMAFFFQAIYTESLYLALSIAFFYYLVKKNFLVAAMILVLASICRITGIFLLLPFAYEYWITYKFKLYHRNSLALLIAPLGVIGYLGYLYVRFGEPLAFLKSEALWGRKFTFNAEHFDLFSPAAYANLSTDLLFLILGLTAGVILLLKWRASFGLYILSTLLVCAATGTLMSINRYVLILFPIYILLASIKNKEIKLGWQLVSTLLLAIYTLLFVNNYWAG